MLRPLFGSPCDRGFVGRRVAALDPRRVDDRLGRFHDDGLELHRRERQCQVHRFADAEPDAGAARLAEADPARRHVVDAERQQGRDEDAALVGDRLTLEAGLRLPQHDGRIRDGRPRGISNRTADDACSGLRLRCDNERENDGQQDQPEPCASCFGLRRDGVVCFGAASVSLGKRAVKGAQGRWKAVEGGNFCQYSMQNPEIARLLSEVADLLEISAGNPFKVRAYRNAARTVADHPDPIGELVKGGDFDLTDLPGIGDGIAKEITALVATGAMPQRQQLLAELPPGLLDLLRIPGLGPKRVRLFHDELKVNSMADLKQALDAGKIAKLPGFGPKLLEKLREGVAGASTGGGPKRIVLHEAEQYARAIVAYLKAGGGIEEIDVAGSFRRRKETIGDLDIVVTCAPAKAPAVIERFGKFDDVTQVTSQGDTRATVRLSGGLQVDLRVVEPACFGAAMQYFTGSQAHNIELRKIAQSKNLKLNEYGVFRGTMCISGRTEQEVYAALGLAWIPPEMRENRGEIALAKAHKLPTLVALDESPCSGQTRQQIRPPAR